jgi:hypothetical protein
MLIAPVPGVSFLHENIQLGEINLPPVHPPSTSRNESVKGEESFSRVETDFSRRHILLLALELLCFQFPAFLS